MNGQKWTLVQEIDWNEVSSSKFAIPSMKNELCLEPINLAIGLKIGMKVCTKESTQSWKYDNYCQTRNDFDDNFCLNHNDLINPPMKISN